MNDHTPSKPFKSLTNTLAVTGSIAILAGTVAILGIFYALAQPHQQRSTAQYAQAKASSIAQAVDIFDQTMRLSAENAYGGFRRQFDATLILSDEAGGTLTNAGRVVNNNTVEVDRFVQDFPGGECDGFCRPG